jgi:tRNA(fMet)-specific endonuclease VapC
MKRFLFDTGIAGDYINDRCGVRERAHLEVASGNRIGICMPILAELFYGIEYSTTRERNLQKLHRALSSLTVWPFTEDDAATYGEISADLRHRGWPMQVVDKMAAAVAMNLVKCTVVSKDSDLWAIPKLSVKNWAQ